METGKSIFVKKPHASSCGGKWVFRNENYDMEVLDSLGRKNAKGGTPFYAVDCEFISCAALAYVAVDFVGDMIGKMVSEVEKDKGKKR